MRIYFSHDPDDPRAEVVRRHWLAIPDHEHAGFFDPVAWGDVSRAGPPTIRQFLEDALDNTTVTCVLIGPQTAEQRWMRFEIVESIQRRNRIIGVHISGILDDKQQTAARGKNPFEDLALSIADDGASVTVLQRTQDKWGKYQDNHGWPLANPAPPQRRGKRIQLSSLYRVYDWVADNGQENFEKWIGL